MEDKSSAVAESGSALHGAPSGSEPSAADRALTLYKNSGNRVPDSYRGTVLEEIFKLAAKDFAAIYKCARGHEIDPVYVAALPYDFLIALDAVVTKAEGCQP